jgi:hypothetical protein
MFSMTRSKIFALTILSVVGCTASAADLYVDNSGSPACSDSHTRAENIAGGGTSNVWCSLIRATWGRADGDRNSAANTSEAAQAGDTVYVAAGTYNYDGMHNAGGHMGDPLYQPANSGSEGNWIVFQGVGDVYLTTSTTGMVAGNGGGIIGTGETTGSEYIEFDSFIFGEDTCYSRWGSGVVQIAGITRSNNVRIENCTITGINASIAGNNHPGIYVHGYRSGGSCSDGLTGIEIRNNTIRGFTGDQSSNDAGITMYCVEEFTIENNEFYGSFNAVIAKNAYNPVGKAQSYFRYNLVRDQTRGFEMQSWNNIEISQNVFRDISTHGVHLEPFIYYGGEPGPQDVEVVNNTFDNCARPVFWKLRCSYFDDNYFYNNIGTNAANIIRDSDSEGQCESPANIGQDDFDFDYNVFEHSGVFWVNDGPSTVVATLQDFTDDFTQGSNQWDDVDCLYADEANNDFRLCTAAGVPVSSCSGPSPCLEGRANDGVDILDLDGDGSTTDALTIGAYITNNETIGSTTGSGDMSSATGLERTDVKEP